MAWAITAIAGGAALAGLGGAWMESNAAKSAANTEANAANNAANTQMSMFNTEQQNAKPYMQAGSNALSQLQGNMGYYNSPFTMSDFQQDPGYQFDLQQGQAAIQRSAAAQGSLLGTGTLAGLNNYSQGMASNEFGNAFNRFMQQKQTSYNNLYDVANMGAQSTGALNQQGTQLGGNIGNAQMAMGQAQAAGQMGSANAWGGALSNMSNSAMQYGMLSSFNHNGLSGAVPGASNLNGSQMLSMPQPGQQEFGQFQSPLTSNLSGL